METDFWKRCSTCKKPIPFGSKYWVCSVSTCNRKRLGLTFCSVECWDGHLPIARHREAWSLEKQAPTKAQYQAELQQPQTKEKAMKDNGEKEDILIVASKLKAYIRAKSGMNTSAEVLETLSDKVRNLCDDAMIRARQDYRKTVMSRDFSGS